MRLRSGLLVGALALGLACSRAYATDLLYASPYGPGHPFSKADITWIRWVEHESKGALRIHAIWSGGLISADHSMTELRHHVADIGLISPIYARSGSQLIRVQTGFYAGMTQISDQIALYRCLAAADPEMAHELEGLTVLAVQGGTLPGILSRSRPLTTLEDLRGLRVRVPTEMVGVMRDLGADPVSMPMGEVYSSLAKGVIDAVVTPTDALRSMHFGEVAKYYLDMKIPRGAYPARAMSSERFAALSPAEQNLLTRSSAIWEAALAAEIHGAAQAGAAQGRRDGVHFSTISDQEQHRFDALYNRDALRSAGDLKRLGLDAVPLFDYARRLADHPESIGAVCPPMRGPG